MRFGAPVPVFRSFDETKAREFYLGFLGFTLAWEHRVKPDTPLYCQVERGLCVLHLSEHFGDATPGGRVRVEVGDIEALHVELAAKRYPRARPGIADQPWGARELILADPFGNYIVFWRGA